MTFPSRTVQRPPVLRGWVAIDGLPPGGGDDGAISRPLARRAISLTLVIIAALSVANFNEGVVPPSMANAQGMLVLALWVVVTALSFALRPIRRVGFGTEAVALLAFLTFAVASVVWSDLGAATLLKGAALTVTSLGAVRLAIVTSVDDLLDAVAGGLTLIGAASLVLVFAAPQYGVDHTYFHEGQWQGVFQSKQSLGTAGALLIFFSFHRLASRGGPLRFLVMGGLGLACVLGSGSRGGAALAVVACAALYASRRSSGLMRALTYLPLVMTVAAAALIAYLYAAATPYIDVFGTRIDFTERAIIWHYAISHFDGRPLLGFGLNGFWSIDELYHAFEREHGWVLDNYHDGYLAILIETGVAGYSLFVLCTWLVAVKLSWLVRSGGLSRSDASAVIGVINMIYFIDFTETFFLRSTNIFSVLLFALLFVVCKIPDGAVATRARRASSFSHAVAARRPA